MSMPDPELYVGLAGVAVVFAGFAGISVALTGRQPEQWTYIDSARLSSMIEGSITVAFFSLMPLLVARFTSSTEAVWRISSALFLIYAVFAPIRASRAVRRAYKTPGYDPDRPLNRILFYLAMAVGIVALALNTFLSAPAFQEGLFLLALLLYLGLAARMFVRTLGVLRDAAPS
jgi:hypothetical protein